jgi:hypothetical protein
MKKYVVKRLLQLIPILLVITFLSFGMMRLAGSDAVMQKMENTGMVVSEEVMDKARAELGLDKPFLTQYFVWLGNLLKGDMGTSYISGKEVFPTFISKLPANDIGNLTAYSGFHFAYYNYFCSFGSIGCCKAKSFYRLPYSCLQFHRQQYAELFCGVAAYVFFCNPYESFSGYRYGSKHKKCCAAQLYTCHCHVCEVPSTGEGCGFR